MERLTKRIESYVYYTQGKYEDTIPAEMETNDIRNVLKKLAYYEDLEEQGLLLKEPCNVEDVVDKLFSHNEIVSLWINVKEEISYHQLIWSGMAWDIPEIFKSCYFVKIFGTIPEKITQADIINIEVVLTEEQKQALARMEGENDES